jgi:regulator of sigma E protease
MILTIISFIFVFGLMVVCHELGHFALAKFNGIIVNEFSIGIGPKLFSLGKGETVYSIRAFPIGGYVKMEGEDEDTSNPRGFTSQSPLRRLSVIAAGPLMNFILAIILLSVIAFSFGFPINMVETVYEGNPAFSAGVQSGDKIIQINNIAVDKWDTVGETIRDSEGDISMTVIRNGDEITLVMTPIEEETTGRRVVGIVPAMEKSVIRSVQYGASQTAFIFKSIYSFLGDMLSGGEVEGEVIGPIGIIGVVGEAARTGFQSLLFVAAYLSVNLGIINLLPFPALDGGRLIFIILEIIRGKPVPPEKEGFVHFVGFAILMALMVFILFKDLTSLF